MLLLGALLSSVEWFPDFPGFGWYLTGWLELGFTDVSQSYSMSEPLIPSVDCSSAVMNQTRT